MRNTVLFIFICLCWGCRERPVVTNNISLQEYDYSKLEGTYLGDFGDSDELQVCLSHVTENNVLGYDVHKGTRRNINGSIKPVANGFAMVLHEPGDHPHDGVFEINLDTALHRLSGMWKPTANRSLTVKKIALTLDTSFNKAGDMYGLYADSIGTLNFQQSGVVDYHYYPIDSAGKLSEQFIEIRGSWRLANHVYIVTWQPNTVFKNKQSRFAQRKLDDGTFDGYQISGEGREFYTGP